MNRNSPTKTPPAKPKLAADDAAEYELFKARKAARKVWMRGYMRDWRFMDKARKASAKGAGDATD
jgi:hypothetical protein